MASIGTQEAKKMSRRVLNKSPLIKCGDASVYQDMDDWKRTRFTGKVQEFSLGNAEFQVAMTSSRD